MRRILTVAFYLLAIEPLAAGQLSLFDIELYNDWTPSSCFKPDAPYFSYVSDADDFNHAVSEFNSFLAEARAYISCVENEGDSDLQTFQSIVSDGVDSAQNEMSDEVDSARSQLESSRP